MPIILGGIATMGYVINFNNRGYERFKLAYDQVAAGKTDEFNGRYTADYLRKLKNNYRRNRDLCIIITAGLYLLNIIDAHVDAHMKDYDVSGRPVDDARTDGDEFLYDANRQFERLRTLL